MKKNNPTKSELPEEPTLTENPDAEEETLLEDEFDGPMSDLELESDEFDDCPDFDKIQHFSKSPATSKPATPFFTSFDKKIINDLIIPPKFICPLSKQMMMDPVRIAGSNIPIAYEKASIEAHYEETGTDPMTHEYLGDDVHFMPDLALKREITDFCLQHMPITETSTADSAPTEKKTR